MTISNALIIDDSAVARKILTSLLAARQIETHYVDSGIAGLEYLQQQDQHLPDVVFLDLELGDMYGLQVLEKASEQISTLPPVIICTGNQCNDEQFRCYKQVISVLVKPYSEAALDDALKRALPQPEVVVTAQVADGENRSADMIVDQYTDVPLPIEQQSVSARQQLPLLKSSQQQNLNAVNHFAATNINTPINKNNREDTIAGQIAAALLPIEQAITALNSRLDNLTEMHNDAQSRLDQMVASASQADPYRAVELENFTLGVMDCLQHNLKAEFRKIVAEILMGTVFQQHMQQSADKAVDQLLAQTDLQQLLQQQIRQAVQDSLLQVNKRSTLQQPFAEQVRTTG